MIKANKLQDLACVEYTDLKNIGEIEKLFLFEPNRIVYVLDNKKLKGIITLGDFKRNYPDLTNAVNENGKKIYYSDDVSAKAQSIFNANDKIKKIPVLGQNNEFLFEIEMQDKDTEPTLQNLDHLLDTTDWFDFYISKMDCKRICVIEKDGFGRRLIQYVGKAELHIDIIKATEFTRSLLDAYDLVIEADTERYDRRRELLRRISKNFTNKYVSPEDMVFFRKTYLYFLEQKKQGVKFYVFEAPSESKLTHISQKQRERIESNHFWSYYYRTPWLYDDEMKEMFGVEDYGEIINSIFHLPTPVKKGETVYYEEYRSEYCNITGGYRVTLNKKWENYTNEINLYGPCAVFGLFVKDQDTISSYLQERVNQSALQYFNVNNYGIRATDIKEMINCMHHKNHKPGDVIIFLMVAEEIDFFRRLDCETEIIELSEAFNQKEDLGLFFIDKPIHCNYKANQLIANQMYKILLRDLQAGILAKNTFIEPQTRLTKTALVNKEVFSDNAELEHYLNELRQYNCTDKHGETGAIVMNCNPFTMGHRYLVEYASARVSKLFVFVVEENKSFFNFEDRMRLVKEGTSDLQNVVVLPSGKFIISSLTFPEYFQKDDKQEVTIDASLDIEVFAQRIAPALGVTIRFVGEEPVDAVTKQYNEWMKEILPCYGIQVDEVKRLCQEENGESANVISASKVRKYLEDGKWESIQKIVPPTTYRYLLSKYSRFENSQ